MFGRKTKQIKLLKEQLRETNRQKLEAVNDRQMLQYQFNEYTRTCDVFISTIKELMAENKKKTTKKKTTTTKKASSTRKVTKKDGK